MRARKIGVLTTSYPRFPGDLAGQFVHSACAALVADGLDVAVEAPHGPRIPGSEERDGVRIRRFRYAPTSLERVAYGSGIMTNLRADPLAWFGLPSFVVSLAVAGRRLAADADVVHCHWIPAALATVISVRRRAPPLIVTVRGSDLDLARRSAFVRRTLGRATLVAAVSDTMRRELIGLGIPEERVTVLRDIVEPLRPTLPRPELRRSMGLRDAPTALFLGRLAPVKGPDLLFDALPPVLASIADAQIVVAGEGAMSAEINARAKALGERVLMPGAITHSRVPSWLAAADVLVLPSRSEGLPIAAVEALSLGIPVIATNVGGSAELVIDGQTGWLVPPNDAASIAHALTAALQSPAGSATRGAAGRAHVERLGFDRGSVVRGYREAYDRVVARSIASSTALDARSSQSNL